MNRKKESLSYHYKGIDIFPRLDLLHTYKIIGSSSNQIRRDRTSCIFCKKTLSGINKTKSHLIPELFGKNISRNNYECDSCNSLSGKWESSMGTFLTPIRIVSKIKNKKGKIPKFKSRLDEYAIQTEMFINDSGTLKGILATKDDLKIDDVGNGRLKFRLGQCNPFDIYKVFLKIALSLMPDDKLKKENWMIKYLFNGTNDKHIFPYLYKVFLDDKMFTKATFELRQIHQQYKYHPQYLLTGYFGKVIIHIVLPIKKPKKKVYLQMPPILEIQKEKLDYEIEKIDLSDTENKKWDMSFKFSSNMKPTELKYSDN